MIELCSHWTNDLLCVTLTKSSLTGNKLLVSPAADVFGWRVFFRFFFLRFSCKHGQGFCVGVGPAVGWL